MAKISHSNHLFLACGRFVCAKTHVCDWSLWLYMLGQFRAKYFSPGEKFLRFKHVIVTRAYNFTGDVTSSAKYHYQFISIW